jgi:hypothetical protein
MLKFLCKVMHIYAGSYVSVRSLMPGEMLKASRLTTRPGPIIRTVFHVILRHAPIIPIYNAFKFQIIVTSLQWFVMRLNVKGFSRGRQAKTKTVARTPMQNHGRAWQLARCVISVTLHSRPGTMQINVTFTYSFMRLRHQILQH